MRILTVFETINHSVPNNRSERQKLFPMGSLFPVGIEWIMHILRRTIPRRNLSFRHGETEIYAGSSRQLVFARDGIPLSDGGILSKGVARDVKVISQPRYEDNVAVCIENAGCTRTFSGMPTFPANVYSSKRESISWYEFNFSRRNVRLRYFILNNKEREYAW